MAANIAPIALQYDYAPMAGSLERMRPREHAIVLVHGMTSAAATFGNVLHELTAVAHGKYFSHSNYYHLEQ